MGCYYEQLLNHWPFFRVLAGLIPLNKLLLYSFILLCSKCITIGPTFVVVLGVVYKMIKHNNYLTNRISKTVLTINVGVDGKRRLVIPRSRLYWPDNLKAILLPPPPTTCVTIFVNIDTL